MKKKAVAFICYDENNRKYAEMFKASLRKFHSAEELPLVEVVGDDLNQRIQKDPQFFYRQKPTIASELIDDYELVIGFDVDQLVMGDLNHILNDTSYDIGTVLNFNRNDYKQYGAITTYIIDCTRYMNCGLVAMRSKDFIEHWKRLCYTDDIFLNLQYREQDVLNILYYFGGYQTKCFDIKDPLKDVQTWNGLVSKGEGLRMKLVDGKVMLPKAADGYPNEDVIIKLYHWAGGNTPDKMNYRLAFNEEIVAYCDWLVKGSNEKRST